MRQAAAADQSTAFLPSRGEMAALIRAFDWAQTPLGPIEAWPSSLRTAVGMILSSRFAMFVWWGEHLVNIYNDAYRPFLGQKHPDALGKDAGLVWSEIWDQVGPRAEAVLRRGESTYDEFLLLPMDRYGYWEETYFTFSYSPVRDESGAIGGLFCAVSEETIRVIGERRLRLLREVAAATPEARTPEQICIAAAKCIAGQPRDLPFAMLYLSEEDGKSALLVAQAGIDAGHKAAPPVIALNDDAIWPLSQANAAGEPLLVGDLSSRFSQLPTGAWDRPPAAAVVMPLAERGQDSAVGYLVAGINPFLLFDAEYRGFFGLLAGQIAADIANARAYAAERKRAEALDALDRAKTAFFSNVSHEFRTPLTLMLGPLEDALHDTSADALPQTQRLRLEITHRNSLRLLQLVNTLLDFSRIEAGRIQASYAPTDLAALTVDLASGFRSAVDRAGLYLEIDCPPLPQPVFVDRRMWETLVLNLLSNAFKFTFIGGIGVTLRPQGGAVALVVRDTGVGIPRHELPRLFERFHRIEGQQSRSFEGSGIGLALVQELVRLHGGEIDVQSTIGDGTTFTITIPFGSSHLPAERIVESNTGDSSPQRVSAFVAEALRWLPNAGEDAANAVVEAEAIQPEATPGPRATVLVADDNTDMRDYVCRLLRDRYDVIGVPNGRAALDAVAHQRPDLLLTDVMMPELDGFALLRAVRADPDLRDIPVILLSARAGEEARVDGLEAGADDYLTKPFAARELFARVGANLALARLRREVTQSALDSAERLRQMFEQAPGFMCMLRGPDHVFELTNAAYRQLIGNRDVLGKQLLEALPEIAGQGYMELLDQVYRSGEAFSGRSMRLMLHRSPDGPLQETFLNFVYQPIRDAGGAVSGIFVEGFDVTDRVQIEVALRELNQSLEARVQESTAELRTALERLRSEVQEREKAQDELRQVQKMESIGQLTGGVAHDFNNLLTVIMGGLERVQRLSTSDNPGLRRAIDLAMQGAQRAATLTERLLAFSRRQPLSPQPTEVNRLVSETAALLHRTLGETVQLESRLSPSLWLIDIDRNQMENALLNLAVNARDAMPNGGTLTIETGNTWLDEAAISTTPELDPGDYVELSVHDTGCGMSPDILERVFEPFFTTKEVGRGTGLGLSQVYGFIKQSGGHVAIDSEQGRGTTVRLLLPRYRGELTAQSPRPVVEPTLRANGEVVLVVEDDAQVRAHTTEVLRELGYALLEATDADEALQIEESAGQIDLLFTDVVLPGGVSGRQLAEQVLARRPGTKVLYTTGYARDAIVHQGRLDPGTALITKPFAINDLAAKVWTVLHG